MSPSQAEKRPSVTAAAKPALEDLLRLKRAERPDAAFWDEFERGLRQKQLAAIIEPRPWWLGLSLLGRRLAPLGLPVSAGAAALFAVITLRTDSPFASETFAPPAAPSVSVAASAPAAPLAPAPAVVVSAPPAAASRPPPAVLASAPAAPARASLPAAAAPALSSAPGVAATPSQQTIARNLEVVRSEEPELLAEASSGPLSAGFADAAPAAFAISDEAEALRAAVLNPRQARVLAALAQNPQAPEAGGLVNLRDRMVRSLVYDDALSASVSRVGVGGDRLSLSF